MKGFIRVTGLCETEEQNTITYLIRTGTITTVFGSGLGMPGVQAIIVTHTTRYSVIQTIDEVEVLMVNSLQNTGENK